MKKLAILLAVMSVGLSFSQQQYSKVKIYTDAHGLQQLSELGVPVDHGTRKGNTFIISDFSEDEIEIIGNNGFMYEVVVDDVKEYYANRNANPTFSTKNANCSGVGGGVTLPAVPANFETSAGSYAGFYMYNEMLSELDDMATLYPNLITVKAPISTFLTWEGRPIYHVKISDNPSTDEAAETKVLYTSIHHAREPMSMSETIFYMWYLLENYATNPEVQYLLDNTEMYFVPCVNPDGYIHNEANDPSGFGMHRKNKRNVGTSNPGVDLNRNYSYQWGTTGVSFNENNDTYPGGPNDGSDYSFSEPETQAMQWLVESIDFTSAYNAHTYGATLLHPIGSTNAEFADHHDYFADLSVHMCSQNGYFPQKSSGLYPASGDADDYMYKVDIGVGNKDTIFVMTPEVGTDFWPAANEVIPTCQEMVFPNMVLSHMTHQYYVVDETDPGMISTLTGDFNHDALRLGLENGAVTVSIDPVTNIQSVGADVIYNLNLRESASNTISFVLNPSIQYGDPIVYVLNTEYLGWTKVDTITKTYGAIPLQFSDDASNTSNWTGQWNTTGAEFLSPSTSFTDSPGSDYSNDDNKTYELIQSIDLTNATEAMVSYYAMWEIEADYDYCQFQVSVDGGSTWTGQCGNYTVEGSSTPWNGSVQPDGDPVYEGTQSTWVLEEISMSDYLGQVINVRFQFESDGGLTQDGFYFDDFSVAYSIDDAGLEENSFNVKTFPNPSNNEATISTSKAISSGNVMIYNQAGQLVFEKDIKEQTNNIVVNTSKFSEGVYTVHVIDNGELARPVKLVVMH